MNNERKEQIIFMAGEGERGESKVSLVHPERGETKHAEESKAQTRYGRETQPPERVGLEVPSAPLQNDKKEEVAEFPTAPERDEQQDTLFGHIEEGRHKEAMSMLLEERGENVQEEMEKPETQKFLEDVASLREEMEKPQEERDVAKLQAVLDNMRGASPVLQDTVRDMLRLQGMSEEQVKELLPTVPVAPTEEEEGHGITAPTEEELTQEERDLKAEVTPFPKEVEDMINKGDLDGAKDETEKLLNKLKRVGKKSALYGWRATYITVLVVALTYIALMAKANALKGK